jgi:hypothetical protein
MSNNFWQNPDLEPKRAFKFILSIPGVSGVTEGIPEFLVKKVKKPEWEITATEHKFLNHSFFYPGRMKWSPIDVTIVDTVSPDSNGSRRVMELLEASGYELPTNPSAGAGWGTVSKKKAVRDALGAVSIITINGEGTEVERWVLNNAWITKVQFGELNYENEELLDVTLSISYDNAFLQSSDFPGNGTIPQTSS